MPYEYQGVFKGQVHILPNNLRQRRCRKCGGCLKFSSSDGEKNAWTCGGSCGMFSKVLLISGEERGRTESYQRQMGRYEEAKKRRRDSRIKLAEEDGSAFSPDNIRGRIRQRALKRELREKGQDQKILRSMVRYYGGVDEVLKILRADARK
jgi:hypothetical protein